MACRFAFFALFALSALFCTDEASSQKPQSSKNVEVERSPTWSYKEGSLFLQFAAPPSLVMAPVPSIGTHITSAQIVWTNRADLKSMASAPKDSVDLVLDDKSRNLFGTYLEEEEEARLLGRLRQHYDVAVIALVFWENLRAVTAIFFVDLVGASAAIDMLQSSSCSSSSQLQELEEINKRNEEIQKGLEKMQKEMQKMMEELEDSDS